MARFTIYSKDGQVARYSGTPIYHGTHLKVGYIEFREVASPTPIAWQVGDYVDYTRTGFRYKLYSVPYPTKNAVKTAAGDSFVYSDVQFHCATKDLEIAPFRDLVISDNTIHFTTLPNVSTYEDVFGIARRIQANLDSFYGEGEWDIRVIDTSDADLRGVLLQTKEFTLSEGNCLDALSQIYSQWRGIGWMYSVVNGVNTITIGRPNIQDGENTTSVFAYGIGNGVKVLKKEQSGKNELATRLYAYGSTRNLIARYYNNITPAIKDAESVYIPNLMIPLSHWGLTDEKPDARKAFLEADSSIVDKYGLRPKTIYFDGSGDYEEIYPSVETLTAGQIRAAMNPTDQYYPKVAFAADEQRVDEVAVAENPSDNGILSTDTGGKYVQTVTVEGVSQDITYNFAHGQNVANIPLENICTPGAISMAGRVAVTPELKGTITSVSLVTSASVKFWLEIGGTKYGEREAQIGRGKNGIYTISLEPFEINTVDTGSVVIKGFVQLLTSGTNPSFQVGLNINPGTTTLAIKTTPTDTFKVHVRQLGFDISKQQSAVSNGIATIAFKSGWCAGREFTVKKCEYQESNDRWVLTVARQNDESIGQYFPNNIYTIMPGDRFVLTDLTMPEIYVTAAMERLYERASETLDALSTPKIIYEPEIDAKVLALSPETILEGMYMPLRDEDIVENAEVINGDTVYQDWVLIDTIEINESEAEIPTYKITLQDEKRESFISKLTKESGRNTRIITDITIKDLRSEVEELTPDIVEDEQPAVKVEASHPIIGYENSFEEEPVNIVTLNCVTVGIDNPSYQWYFLGEINWVPIPGATGQAYVVDPDSALYYLNGEIVEDFRCVVSGNPEWADTAQIMKVLSNAITVSLSNPAHIYAAGVRFAEPAEDRTDVLGYKGVERFATNVKMSSIRFLDYARIPLTVAYNGGGLLDNTGKYLTDSQGRYLVTEIGDKASISDTEQNVMMTVEVVDNYTTTTYLKITVTEYMDIPAGVIEVPVVIRPADAVNGITEKVVNLYYSWGLALQGNSSFTSTVFKRSASQPETPTGGDFDHPVPQGWSDGIPSGDDTLWMSMRIFSANGFYPQQDSWSTPTGAFDTADLDFEFSATETLPVAPNTGYDPSHDFPSPNNIWHNDPTSSDIWMAMRKKSGGVWGAWEILKVKGEKGESPLFADIENEADGLAVGDDGILSVAMNLDTRVHLWYGETAETITLITPVVPAALSSKISVSFPQGYADGAVRVAIAANTDFSSFRQVEIPLSITCARGSRSVTYTIIPVREGEDGTVYVLQPTADIIKGSRANDNTITYDPSGISCSRMARKGSGDLASSSFGVLKMSVDGGTTKKNYASISSGSANWNALIAAGKVIYYWFDNAQESHLIDRETIPVVVDGAKGADGVSASTIYLYKRSANGAPSVGPNVDLTYTFATGALSPKDSGANTYGGGWYRDMPTGTDPCYVTMAFVKDSAETKVIKKGYNTASTPGDWAPATRLTGENGLMGKVMRGINEFSSNGLPNGRPDGQGGYVAGYQGMDETDRSIIYYDMVYQESGGNRVYYYCKDGNGAKDHAPGVSGSGWENYWVVATQFDFVATRVLLASNAFIDVLSGNAVYLYDNGQDYVVAGVQGGSTTTSGGETVPQVNFFAGTDETHPDPLNAPFRVTYNGVVYCKDIRISGGEIQISNGNAVVFSVSNTGALVASNATITGGSISIKNGSNEEVFKVSTTGKLTASDVDIVGSIKASGNKYSGEGSTYAIESENGFRMSGGTAFFKDGGINSYAEKSGANSSQVIQSKRGNKIAKAQVAANTTAATTTIEATSTDSGDGDARMSVSTGSYGLATIRAEKDSSNYAELNLYGTTSNATITRKVGGTGSEESIVSSPTIRHIEIREHGQVPEVGSRDANTLYFEKKA